MDGFLLVDKPAGISSHDVVLRIRRERGEPRAGHAGTLDPIATGLLLVALGRGVRLLEYLQGLEKTYEVEIELGTLTETDDREGAPRGRAPVPSRADLEAAAARLRGEIEQRPPAYSAVKVAGKRLYRYAREGTPVEAPARRVTVSELSLLSYDPPRARFRVRGSKGLYVRSIARDLGGHVTELRRTAVGPFRVEDAGPEPLPAEAAVAHLPEVPLSPEEAEAFRNGRFVPRPVPGIVRVAAAGRFLGVGEPSGGGMKPAKVILPRPDGAAS